jgi:hypothetical protein
MGFINSMPSQNIPSWQQSAGSNQQIGGASGNTGGVGQSGFLGGIVRALEQSLTGASATSSAAATSSTALSSTALSSSSASSSGAIQTTQNQEVAMQAFLQNLFASLGQANIASSSANGTASKDTSALSGIQADSSTLAVDGHHHGGGSHMTADIQGLLQQMASSNPSASSTLSSTSSSVQSSGPASLNQLASSFQNLVSAFNASQGQSASAGNAPTLQSFLQNLYQSMSGAQSANGSIVSTQI